MVIGGESLARELPMDGFEVVNVAEQRRCMLLPKYPLKMIEATGQFYDGKIVACGGSVLISETNDGYTSEETDSCYQYHLQSKAWFEFGHLLEAAEQSRSASVNEKLWITGGSKGSDTLSKTQYYNENGNEFARGPDLPAQMRSHCFVQINRTLVFLSDISGLTPPPNQLSAYLIHWETGEHTNLPNVPKQRDLASCGLTWTMDKGLEIVVVGNEEYQDHGSSDIFSVSDMSWREGPPVGQNVFGAALAQLDHTFVLTGGVRTTQRQEYADTVMRYDPEEEKFVALNFALGTARAYHVTMSVPNGLFPCPGKKLYFEFCYSILKYKIYLKYIAQIISKVAKGKGPNGPVVTVSDS